MKRYDPTLDYLLMGIFFLILILAIYGLGLRL